MKITPVFPMRYWLLDTDIYRRKGAISISAWKQDEKLWRIQVEDRDLAEVLDSLEGVELTAVAVKGPALFAFIMATERVSSVVRAIDEYLSKIPNQHTRTGTEQ